MNFIKSSCPKCGAKMYINCDAETNICAACDSVVLTKDVVKDSRIHTSVPNTKNELDDLYERFHTISISI